MADAEGQYYARPPLATPAGQPAYYNRPPQQFAQPDLAEQPPPKPLPNPPPAPQPAVTGRRERPSLLVPGVKMALMLLAAIFCFLAFVIMATVMATINKFGNLYDQFNYRNRSELRVPSPFDDLSKSCSYLIAVGVIGFVYSLIQMIFGVINLATGKSLMPEPMGPILDFASCQIMTYFFMSASSAAAAIRTTKKFDLEVPSGDGEYPKLVLEAIRDGNIVLEKYAASISMGMFAFLAFAISAIFFGSRILRTWNQR